MAGPFDDLIEKYSPRAAQAPGTGPFDDLIEKAKADRDPVAITQRIKTDPDFQPTDEQLDIAYAHKRDLSTFLSDTWGGLKYWATEYMPNLARKAREENPNPLAFLWSPTEKARNLATGAEALLSGSQQLGQMVLPAIHSVIDAIANGLAAPVPINAPDMPERMAKQAWLERTRAAAENQRAMQPYQEGDQAFIPTAKPATAQLFANLGADPTILIPGAKAAGLLKFAAPAARTAATVGLLGQPSRSPLQPPKLQREKSVQLAIKLLRLSVKCSRCSTSAVLSTEASPAPPDRVSLYGRPESRGMGWQSIQDGHWASQSCEG